MNLARTLFALATLASNLAATDFAGWVRSLENRGVRVACEIVDLDDATVLFSHRAREPLVPASNMKVLTTAAMLELLGIDGQFATDVIADGVITEGTLRGDLWFRAQGDPGLQAPIVEGDPGVVLERVGRRLRAAGIDRVTGRLVLDGGVFDVVQRHASWPERDFGKPHAAPITAFSLAGATVTIALGQPGGFGVHGITLLPARSGLRIDDDLRSGSRAIWGASVRDGVLKLTGRVPAGEIAPQACSVDDPERVYANVLYEGLRAAGVTVGGGVYRVNGGTPEREALFAFGTPMGTLVHAINKESLNHAACVAWKALGARYAGEGSFEGGARAVRAALAKLGVPEEELALCTLAEGSGLGRDNRITARVLVEIHRRVAERPYRTVFLTSLPIGGIDGSLSSRMKGTLRGKVRAKTGWIRGASSLSGQLVTRSGRRLVFAMLMSYGANVDGLNSGLIKPAQDELLESLHDDR